MNLIEVNLNRGRKFYKAVAAKIALHPQVSQATMTIHKNLKREEGQFQVYVKANMGGHDYDFRLRFANVTEESGDLLFSYYNHTYRSMDVTHSVVCTQSVTVDTVVNDFINILH